MQILNKIYRSVKASIDRQVQLAFLKHRKPWTIWFPNLSRTFSWMQVLFRNKIHFLRFRRSTKLPNWNSRVEILCMHALRDRSSSAEAYLVEANFNPIDLKHRGDQSRSFFKSNKKLSKSFKTNLRLSECTCNSQVSNDRLNSRETCRKCSNVALNSLAYHSLCFTTGN